VGSNNDAPIIVKRNGTVAVNYDPGDLVTFKHGFTSTSLNGIIGYGTTSQRTLTNQAYNACMTAGEPYLRTVNGVDQTIANGTINFVFMDDQGNYTDVSGNVVTNTQITSSSNPNAACYYASGANTFGATISSVFRWNTCPSTSTSMNMALCTM